MSKRRFSLVSRAPALALGIALGLTPAMFVPKTAMAVVITTGCGGGMTCTLGQLFAGGTIQVDDLLFSGFSTSLALNSTVTVSGVGVGTSVLGLDLDFGTAATGIGGVPSFSFDYEVSTAVSGLSVLSSTIELLDVRGGNSTSDFVSYTSSMNPGTGPLNVTATATAISSPTSASLSFSPAVGGSPLLTITESLTAQGAASLTRIQHTFSTQLTAVPEPVTLSLLSLGVAGLAGWRMRRKA